MSNIQCPGCGAKLPGDKLIIADRYHASEACWELFGELSAYEIEVSDFRFLHQYSVDAYGAQHTGDSTRNITTVFSLVGLYLAIEKGYTGRQVQLTHMELAKQKVQWPRLSSPVSHNEVTVNDVMQAEPGKARDAMQRKWMEAVWKEWSEHHEWVRQVCRDRLANL